MNTMTFMRDGKIQTLSFAPEPTQKANPLLMKVLGAQRANFYWPVPIRYKIEPELADLLPGSRGHRPSQVHQDSELKSFDSVSCSVNL